MNQVNFICKYTNKRKELFYTNDMTHDFIINEYYEYIIMNIAKVFKFPKPKTKLDIVSLSQHLDSSFSNHIFDLDNQEIRNKN